MPRVVMGSKRCDSVCEYGLGVKCMVSSAEEKYVAFQQTRERGSVRQTP